jgi:hypothetical protein
MSGNAQKTPLARTLNKFSTQKALDQIEQRGQGLPGIVKSIAGSIVTIDFQVSDLTLQPVEMTVFGSEYIRLPIQAGDKGVALPASVYIGGVTGLGGGVSDTTLRGNTSTLIWFPVGNSAWTLPPGADANTLAMYGKTALLLLNSLGGASSVKLTATGITFTFGSASIAMNSSGITLSFGGSSIVISSTGVSIMGVDFITHFHTLVQTGGGDSGPVGG